MRKLLLIALLPLAGCAMTPQEQDRFRENFFHGLGATQQQPRPVYYPSSPPPPMPRTTTCRNSFGTIVCDTY